MVERGVRIGFVGVGRMGQCAHLRNYVAVPGCRVAAIADPRQATAQRVAERYGVPKVYADAAAMLAREDLDALVACQPFTRHGVLLAELLKAGKPIFIEKPLAGTPEAGRAIVDAVAASGTWIMVGYHKRSDPATAYAVAKISELRRSGELGQMTSLRILMPAGDWVADGFADLIDEGDQAPPMAEDPPSAEMGPELTETYRAFVNYYIHQVNLARHLPGEPYSVEYAHPSGRVLVGTSASGTPCVIEMSPYRTTIDWQESAMVTYERGYVKLELPAPLARNRPGRVEVFHDPGGGATPETTVPQLPWVDAMRQQAMNFVAAVRGERAPVCDAAEALEDLLLARDFVRLWKGV